MKRRGNRPFLGSPNAVAAGLMVAVLAHVHNAQAKDLRPFISDLYGGQGITLADTPGFNHAHHFSEASIDQLSSLGSTVASGFNLSSPSTAAIGFAYNIETGLPVT